MKVEELLSRLKPAIGDERAKNLWLMYSLAEDWEKKNEIESMIQVLAAKHLDQFFEGDRILLPPPDEGDDSGLCLGTIFYGEEPVQEYSLGEKSLLEHVAAFGATGTGKTNFGFLLVRTMLERGIPFTVYSWKREYRDILSTNWDGIGSLRVFTVGRDIAPFSFNPFLPPPNTPADAWTERIVDVMSHAYFLGHGVRHILHQILSRMENPTPQSLLVELERMKALGRKRQWIDSAVRAVGDLCLGPAGKSFSGSDISFLDSLLHGQAILELDALGEDAKTFFAEALLAWIHQFRLAREERGKLLHVNLLEEAHRLILKKGGFEPETVMDLVFREVRELGEAIVLFDQNLSTISKAALGNAGTTVLFRQKHGDDLRAGADLVLLDQTKRDWLGRLPTGWAIVRAASGEGPFLLHVPFVELKRGRISDEEIRKRFLSYSAMIVNKEPPETSLSDIPPIPAEDKRGEETGEQLDHQEIEFLKDIVEHVSGVVERYRRLGFSRSRGNAIKADLINRKIIQEDSVAVGKGAIKFHQLTEKGRSLLAKMGIDVSKVNLSGNHGGPEHRYWAGRIGNEIERSGFDVEKEHRISEGGYADLVVKESNTAIEIETGKSRPMQNVTKDLNSKFDKVIVVSTSARDRARILEELQKKRNQVEDTA